MANSSKKNATVLRTASVHFYQSDKSTYEFQQLQKMIDEYDHAVEYFLEEGWKGQGLDRENINLKTLKAVTKRFPAKKDLGIQPRMGDLLSGRMNDCARSRAQGIISSRCQRLLQLYGFVAYCRKNNHDVATKKWQRLLSKERREFKCPKAPRTSHMEIDSKIVYIRNKNTRHLNPDRPFILDFYYMWSADKKEEAGCKSNKFSISIPASVMTKRFERKGGIIRGGILIGRESIDLRFDVPVIIPKNRTKDTASIDPGARRPIASTRKSGRVYKGNFNEDVDTLISIVNKCTRKKNGSIAQKKSKKHLDNFIGMVVNRLFYDKEYAIDEVSTIILEDMRHMQGTNKFYSMLPFGIMRERIERRAEERGIKVKKQNSAYRSQRCSSCGFVHKDNRAGALFLCVKCEFTYDSDDNACDNHNATLTPITYEKGKFDNIVNGFYWLEGQIITDPNLFPKKS